MRSPAFHPRGHVVCCSSDVVVRVCRSKACIPYTYSIYTHAKFAIKTVQSIRQRKTKDQQEPFRERTLRQPHPARHSASSSMFVVLDHCALSPAKPACESPRQAVQRNVWIPLYRLDHQRPARRTIARRWCAEHVHRAHQCMVATSNAMQFSTVSFFCRWSFSHEMHRVFVGWGDGMRCLRIHHICNGILRACCARWFGVACYGTVGESSMLESECVAKHSSLNGGVHAKVSH